MKEKVTLPTRALLLDLYLREKPAPKVVKYGFGSHESSVNLCDALRYFFGIYYLLPVLSGEIERASVVVVALTRE